MTDQSGAFPEGLREAPWDSLIDVVTAYVNDRPVISGGDSDRAVILAAIDRLRAALERPRPPERVHDDVTRSDHDGARASDVLGEAPERADTPSVAGDRTESEKERRVHYQDIVYGVLARLETLTGERNTQATREATIALLERALERPRPAPPDYVDTSNEAAAFVSWLSGQHRNGWCSAEVYDRVRDELNRLAGGSAGTGAAPPDPQVIIDLAEKYIASGVLEYSNKMNHPVAVRAFAAWARGELQGGGAGQPPPSAPDDDPMSAEFLEKYESLGHWCPNGDRVRQYSFAVCSMCMGKDAIQIVQLRGVPREETKP
jgi:hypothetical protein